MRRLADTRGAVEGQYWPKQPLGVDTPVATLAYRPRAGGLPTFAAITAGALGFRQAFLEGKDEDATWTAKSGRS